VEGTDRGGRLDERLDAGADRRHAAVDRRRETQAWLNGLITNEVTFFGGHTDVRKAVGAGEFKLGLVNHYYYHLQKAEGSNVGIIFPDQGEGQIGLITNATAAAVVNGAPHVAAAQAFLDFLVSRKGQKLFAEQNYEYPLLAGCELHRTSSRWMVPLADVDVAKPHRISTRRLT
jgi:ABC-type Fe3+ transport system substrate-binding protein